MKSVLFLTAIALLPINVFAASFDCNKAVTVTEKTICGDYKLSLLDDILSIKYSKIIKEITPEQKIILKNRQLEWIRSTKLLCTDQDKIKICLKDLYSKRISELNDMSLMPTIQVTNAAQESKDQVAVTEKISVENKETPDKGPIKTIDSEGIGSTLEAAVQNAAENALITVVGSFVINENTFKKSTNISDGIKKQSKEITTQTKEYSQGSIKKFEVLEVNTDNLYRVKARVDVRIDDFKAFIAKQAEGETKVKADLTAKVVSTRVADQTNRANEFNAKAILVKDILLPVLDGTAVNIIVGNPELFKDEKTKQNLRWEIKDFISEKTLVIPVEFIVKDQFLENTKKILENIVFDKKHIRREKNQEERRFIGEINSDKESNKSVFSIYEGGKLINIYILNGTKKPIKSETNNSKFDKLMNHNLLDSEFLCSDEAYQRLQVQFYDDKNNILEQDVISIKPSWEYRPPKGIISISDKNWNNLELCQGFRNDDFISIVNKISVKIFINTDMDIIEKIKSVKVKLID